MSVSAADRHRSVLPPAEQYLEVGYNYRMTDLQAAVGIVQLGKLDEVVERRRELAARYRDAPSPTSAACAASATPPTARRTSSPSGWRCARTSRSTATGCSNSWPWPTSPLVGGSWPPTSSRRTPATSTGRCPSPSTSPTNTLILPLFHQMTDDEQDRVVDVVLLAAAETEGAR